MMLTQPYGLTHMALIPLDDARALFMFQNPLLSCKTMYLLSQSTLYIHVHEDEED